MKTAKRILMALIFTAALAAFAPAALAQSETVVAEFDGGKITAEEINLFLNTINPQYLSQLSNPQMKEMLVSQIVESAVLANLARSIGVDKDPEVAATIEFQTNSILASRYFDKEIKPQREAVQVSDAELKKHYDDHNADYLKNEVKARHILVDTEDEAKALYKQLTAAPDTFAAVAKEKSKDKGSAENGGDLGWFSRGRMVPAFEEAAFKTPKGTISEPIKTQFGWHIIMVDDKHENYTAPFDEVKDEIHDKVLEAKKKEVVDAYLGALKEKAHLKTYPDLFSKVGPPPAKPEQGAEEGATTPPAPPAAPASEVKTEKKEKTETKPAAKTSGQKKK